MFSGTLIEINLASTMGQPLVGVMRAQANKFLGLEGDRYGAQAGSFSKKSNKPRDISLIEWESLEALERDYKLVLSAAASRRNLLTKNVPLNHLVAKYFWVGEVLLHGVELCHPCGYLEQLTGMSVKQPLLHRGGLRAQVIEGGWINIGDIIRPASEL